MGRLWAGRKSLFGRFLTLYVPLTLLAIMVIEGVITSHEIIGARERLDRKVDTLLASQSIILSEAVAERDRARIRVVIASTIADPDIVGVCVRDTDGKQLDKFGEVDGPDVLFTRSTGINFVDTGSVERVGKLILASTDRRINEMAWHRLRDQLVAIVFIVLGAVACAYFAYARSIGRPMKRLLAAIDESRPMISRDVEQGARDDEMGRLVQAYNAYLVRTREAANDLTEAKDKAETANRAKTAFLAQMSHELRTPLNSIIGFAEIMSDEYLGPHATPRYRQYSADIRNSAAHLLMVINDILDISKIESGELELEESTVDLNQMADDTVAMMRTNAEAGDIALSTDVPPSLPWLRGDDRLIRQVLLNLLSNAIKFTPRGGKVSITASLDPSGDLHLSVVDTGIGIATGDLATVFEPFGQLRTNIHHTHPGTGLGVPIARHFCELHGGTLTLDSTPRRGTCATATFPAARLVTKTHAKIESDASDD